MNKILIIDIETTGFLNKGGSIVEIGAVELDLRNGQIKEVFSSLCREKILTEKHRKHPFGWIFENSDLKIDDVRNAPYFESVKNDFQEIINKYPLGVTAFNNDFDFGFLEDRGINFPIKLGCPMKISTDICKIPHQNRMGYKWPKVEEAFYFFFPGIDYKEKHRGADDAHHEAMIVYELFKMGKFKINETNNRQLT